MKSITVNLVRHGTPSIQNSLLGHTDCELTANGQQELLNTLTQLAPSKQLLSSPLKRCHTTSLQYAKKHNLALQTFDCLKECNFGLWDGVSYSELKNQDAAAAENFFRSPNEYPPPNGEPLSDFHQRVVSGFKTIVHTFSDVNVMTIITHSGVIRSLIAWCLDMDFRRAKQFQHISIDYASVTQLTLHIEASGTLFPVLNFTNHVPNSKYGDW
ncbi:MAG: histidine phosphatase family protein [Gammaproteobacteria bacterium]|nr:histidine phosphatase family protein [Gammaproteobacteria bacterium]NVK87592.1 histidine phosphatase family protein [Gammaproteobacteria bacterium]